MEAAAENTLQSPQTVPQVVVSVEVTPRTCTSEVTNAEKMHVQPHGETEEPPECGDTKSGIGALAGCMSGDGDSLNSDH